MQPSLIHDLDRLQHGVADAWKSFDVATVNGNAVRCRIMQDATANWHVHDDSDELFYVISGAASLDTEHGTHPLAAGQLLVVPAGTRHRARVKGRATLLIVDNIR
jgi:mannose-6-phosphate isomerase-like protein (cupin superfamily)